jgi:hypothetical protein
MSLRSTVTQAGLGVAIFLAILAAFYVIGFWL